jgi:putative redox protein
MTAATVKKPPAIVELVWEHDLVLGGRSGDVCMTLDSASREGPSPVQALAFALAGCMAMDVVHILKKGRYDLRGLRVDLVGERAQEEPRRLIAVDVRFTITGTVPGEQVQRAIDLSHEKYCSVWHSMRQDIPMTTSFQVTPGL